MDNETSILGDYFDSYWENGASDALIRKLSNQYDWNMLTLENDVFRDSATAYRQAINNVLGLVMGVR